MSFRRLRHGLLHGGQDLPRLGVTTQLGLAEHAAVIDVHLEHAATPRHDHDFGDVVLGGFQQLGCQTGSAIAVASNGAILDADAHVAPLRGEGASCQKETAT